MLAAVLIATLAALPPPPGPSAAAATVLRVEVEGLQRTSPAYVRAALGVSPGDPFDAAAVPALEQRLLNRRIFRTVTITPETAEGGVVLRVAAAEKLTRVALPIAGASRGVISAGVAVLDANALGGGQQLVLGFLGSNRGLNGFGSYRDPGLAYTRWLLSVRGAALETRRERFHGRDVLYRYRERQLEYAVSAGRRLDERWSLLAGWTERRNETHPSEGFAPPPRGGAVRGPIVELELDAADQRDWILEGVTGRAEWKQGLRLDEGDRRTSQLTLTATASTRVRRDHALSLMLRLDRVRGDSVLDAARLGGLAGSRGFQSQGLWAEDGLEAALEYQVPVFGPRWGVVAAAAFCDAGQVRWEGDRTRYLAPGAGVRVYLRNVAIPLLGFDVAWATVERAPAFSVQLGLRR